VIIRCVLYRLWTKQSKSETSHMSWVARAKYEELVNLNHNVWEGGARCCQGLCAI